MIYLKSLEIENVRCFGKKQRIDFTSQDGKISRWTVILGDNGTGKTTLLRSIVSLLPTPQSFLGKRTASDTAYDLSINGAWRNAWDLKHKEGENPSSMSLMIAECEVPFGNEEFELPLAYYINHLQRAEASYISSKTSTFDTKICSPVYCFAYGANRKMAEQSLSGDSFSNTSETLFKDDALLQNSSEYFLRLDYETAKSRKSSDEKNRVKELLLKVLPEGVKDVDVVKSGRLLREVRVKTDFGWVNLNDLSLGHKTTIAWLIDFATKMIYYHEKAENPFDEPAILILDEIDLHMHPAWQREIIENLTKIFTKTQFIVTAHSPLIVQAALDSNLVLLKKKKDEIKVYNEPQIVNSWRIDQVLTSDLFGLKDARSKQVEKDLSKRRRLLLKEEPNQSDKRELHELELKIGEIPVAETPEYMEAMEIILKSSKRT